MPTKFINELNYDKKPYDSFDKNPAKIGYVNDVAEYAAALVANIPSPSPFNAFQYYIFSSSSVLIPTSGNCTLYVSEGEIFGVYINKTTLNGLNIGQYLTNRLNNIALLINIPTLNPENSILTLTTITDMGSYVIFNMAEPIAIGNQDIQYGGGGAGTITFIP